MLFGFSSQVYCKEKENLFGSGYQKKIEQKTEAGITAWREGNKGQTLTFY